MEVKHVFCVDAVVDLSLGLASGKPGSLITPNLDGPLLKLIPTLDALARLTWYNLEMCVSVD